MEPTEGLNGLDPEILERVAERGAEIRRGASTSPLVAAGLAAASIPVAFAVLARDAFAQGALPSAVVTVLNFALTLEYLESTFYNTGLGTSGLIANADLAVFQQIALHENDHVALLQAALGSSAITAPKFDFSGGSGSGTGPFGDPFSDYATFQALSQAFEDTGVRAYKGQVTALQAAAVPSVLTTALQIHSVEARHAAMVRRLRGAFADTAPNKGWITLAETDISGTSATYAGEDNTTQATINLTSLGYTSIVCSEAFDEPLTMSAVLAIAGLFIDP
jgi:hypothetical protein